VKLRFLKINLRLGGGRSKSSRQLAKAALHYDEIYNAEELSIQKQRDYIKLA
jgi:hypothetical protein